MTTTEMSDVKSGLSGRSGPSDKSEEILIVGGGQQIAQSVAPGTPDAMGQARALAARIRASRTSRAGQLLGTGTSVRDLVEDGRR
jgi:hypothetical protein